MKHCLVKFFQQNQSLKESDCKDLNYTSTFWFGALTAVFRAVEAPAHDRPQLGRPMTFVAPVRLDDSAAAPV